MKDKMEMQFFVWNLINDFQRILDIENRFVYQTVEIQMVTIIPLMAFLCFYDTKLRVNEVTINHVGLWQQQTTWHMVIVITKETKRCGDFCQCFLDRTL